MSENGKKRGKNKDRDFHQLCVFQGFCDDAEIGDESSHAQNGNDGVLNAFCKYVIRFLKRNGQIIGSL